MFSTKAGAIVWEGDGRGDVASTTFPYLHHSLECCLFFSYTLVTVSYIDGTGFVMSIKALFCFFHLCNKITATEDKKSAPSEQDEEDTTEEDQEQEEEISDADEDFDPEDEEDSPPQRKKRKLPAAALQPGQQQQQQQQPRRRGRPPASKGAVTDSQKVVEKIERRRKKSEQEQEQLEKDIQVVKTNNKLNDMCHVNCCMPVNLLAMKINQHIALGECRRLVTLMIIE